MCQVCIICIFGTCAYVHMCRECLWGVYGMCVVCVVVCGLLQKHTHTWTHLFYNTAPITSDPELSSSSTRVGVGVGGALLLILLVLLVVFIVTS